MINVNRILGTGESIATTAKGLFFPDLYIATSIADFVQHRGEVAPLPFLKKALSTARFPLQEKRLAFGKSLILVSRVNYHQTESGIYLCDLSGEIGIGAASQSLLEQQITEQGISENDRLQSALLLYDPRRDHACLYRVRKIREIPRMNLANSLAPCNAYSH